MHRASLLALLLLSALPALAGVNRWTIDGPESAGAANQIVYDPGDSSIVYCATLNGLYRSIDHGAHWSAVAPLFLTEIFNVHVVQTDPRIVYAATSHGLWRSDDRGVTWRAVNFIGLLSMAVSQQNPNIIYGLSVDGPVRSNDGGVTFGPRGSGVPTVPSVLAVDPQSPDTAYLGYYGVYKTNDGGAHWTHSDDRFNRHVLWLAVDPSNGSTIYAGVDQDGIFKTTDGGKTWSSLPTGFSNLYGYSVVIDPRAPGSLLAATDRGALKSSDGGATWTRLNLPNGADVWVNAVAIDPQSSANLLVNARGKVLRSSDGGATFTDATSGILSFSTSAIVVDRHDEAVVYAGGFSGFYKSSDYGRSWSASTAVSVGRLAVDADSSTFYALSGSFVRRSTDGGATWPAFNAGLPSGPLGLLTPTFLVADPQLSGTLYTIVAGTVYKKIGDAPWSARGSGLSGTMTFLTIDPHDSSTLYTGGPADLTAGLFKSTNGGESWSSVNASLTFGAGVPPIGLAVDPFDSRHLFAWSAVAEYQSTDGGASWLPFAVPFTGGAVIVFDAAHPGVIYSSTLGTLERSADGGKTWSSLQSGLSVHGPVVVGPRGATLYAGGTGGVFVFQFGRGRAAGH